jgi:hypothetical protein
MHELLRQWGELGRRLARAPRPTPSWEPVQRIATAAVAFFARERQRVAELLKRSDQKLAPLTDPLALDLGLHRWLAVGREEAYSDWLAWAVQQLTNPRDVFALFRVKPPDEFEWPTDPAEVVREHPVPTGHEDRTGRLDLVVRYAGRALLVVEVKLGSADDADTAKQSGYAEWSKAQPEPLQQPRLLATDAEESESEGGFELVPWEHACQKFRRFALKHIAENRVSVAALTLAFVAAVEQNLLRLRAPTDSAFVNPRLAPYLSKWLEERPQ